jgi:hypothetical protein
LLQSGSTRRTGIVTLYDLPATILNFLNIPAQEYTNGRPLTITRGNWQDIMNERNELVHNFIFRWPLLTVYGYILIGLIVLSILGLIFWPSHRSLFKGIGYTYLFLLTVPGVFLLEALINPLNWVAIIGWTLGLCCLFYLLAFRLAKGSAMKMLGLISLFTVILIIFDGFFNGYTELRAFLGYSAVAGARFYGIGNEYMGFLLGAYLVFVALGREKIRDIYPQILWFLACFFAILLAPPNFGANIGGGITALFGLGVTNYLVLQRPVKIKEILALVVSVLALLVLIGLWDYFFSGNTMTHFGRLITLIKSRGWGALGDLFNRKWAMNLKLIAYTPLSKALIGLLVATPFFYRRPPKPIATLLERFPNEMRAFFGLVIMAMVALLVNDSGIVAVATMFIFGVPLLLRTIYKP